MAAAALWAALAKPTAAVEPVGAATADVRADETGEAEEAKGPTVEMLSMEISQWLELQSDLLATDIAPSLASLQVEAEACFLAADIETVEDLIILVQSTADLEQLGLPSQAATALWPVIAELLGRPVLAVVPPAVDVPGGCAEVLEMSIGEWLAAHGAAQLEATFADEEVETVEDLIFLVQSADDLVQLGLPVGQVATLWLAIEPLLTIDEEEAVATVAADLEAEDEVDEDDEEKPDGGVALEDTMATRHAFDAQDQLLPGGNSPVKLGKGTGKGYLDRVRRNKRHCF